jgi:sugar/nucleoside kinase (ribokinase family)
VFVGAATLDAIALTSRFPGPDERVLADEVVHAGGGPAATAAVAAARLGIAAAFVGTVGDDEQGEQITAGLRAEGVDVSGVTVASGQQSGSSVVVVDRGRGTRAICSLPAPEPAWHAVNAAVEQAGWVHVDHVGWGPVHRVLAARPAAGRPRLSVDAGNSVPGLTPEGVDLFVPTVGALRDRYGPLEDGALLDAALDDGARAVVATRGAAGSLAATGDGERAAAGAYAADVVSTLGAGDVFHGALLACVLRELPLHDCLVRANAVAALSCRSVDGRSAIPTEDELTALLALAPSQL